MISLFFDHQIFSWQKYGGISRYICELAGNLARLSDGPKVHVMSPVYVNRYLNGINVGVGVCGWRIPHVRRTGRIILAFNRFISRILLRTMRVDLIHETYYAANTVAPRRAKIVLTVFDMIHELYAGTNSAGDLTSRNKRLAVERADHIICISESTRQDLIRIFKVDPSRTSVIHLGFSLTRAALKSPPATLRPYLLYVGLRSGYKNYDKFLEAYATSTEMRNRFDLLAFGGGAFSPREQGLIERLGLGKEHVRQLDGDDELLGAVYKNAALFVYPSLYEGFGIPPLEAMSFDCPVACSNTSSLPEVVGDAAILFDPASVESIRETLMTVLTNDELKNDLRHRGRLRVKDFSWQKCAEETLVVYRKVLQ